MSDYLRKSLSGICRVASPLCGDAFCRSKLREQFVSCEGRAILYVIDRPVFRRFPAYYRSKKAA